ncbi:hypothetical protein [Thermocoleostomius sinensis]|uniref:Uncharacterized protein n=1 Tax=Thermocoleostomius sinensis A174 TaxID=2016057 RepID=A0A9E8ZEQ9_9CYAN|nr:hypothetical protein [Thermocoleostomius sinensis]WAL59850.1 hypothetical protein OXH18_22190 [Thermocoleostomius sinensis A174]
MSDTAHALNVNLSQLSAKNIISGFESSSEVTPEDLIRGEVERYLREKIELEVSNVEKELIFERSESDFWKEYSRQNFNVVKHIFDETRNSLTLIFAVAGTVLAFFIRDRFNNFKQVEERFEKLTEEVELKNNELLELKEKTQELKDELTAELAGVEAFKENLKQQYSEVYDFLRAEELVK